MPAWVLVPVGILCAFGVYALAHVAIGLSDSLSTVLALASLVLVLLKAWPKS